MIELRESGRYFTTERDDRVLPSTLKEIASHSRELYEYV
jgi:hypothetical protein